MIQLSCMSLILNIVKCVYCIITFSGCAKEDLMVVIQVLRLYMAKGYMLMLSRFNQCGCIAICVH